ncbi:MAG TPA: hypothetical protein VNG31_01155 [Candidatus Baltobacteraceae bacterium]|nr:hypothetical protein [Candidatus Baltobacteraceae bacterium]
MQKATWDVELRVLAGAQHDAFPLQKRGTTAPEIDDDIERFASEHLDELCHTRIRMHAAQDVTRREREVVLDELVGNPELPIALLRERLLEVAALVSKDVGLNDQASGKTEGTALHA